MADNVSVTFSAQIGQLISGVDQVKEAIGSIAAPVNALVSVFSGFGEAFAGAFAISQVADFVSQMEALGTNTVRTAAILGGTTTEAQQLGFIAKATGGDTESLALSMERLQVNLQKAQSGTGPAAQALQALGLSAKSLIGLPLEEQLNRIADAVSKFADGGNKTAIVMELLGRGGAQMIPVLDKGRDGLDELRQAAGNAGAVVSKDTVDALDRAGTAGTVLRASLTALGEAIVASFAKPLIEATNSLTTFVGDMAALVQTGHLGEAALAELAAGARTAAANFASLAIVVGDVLTLQWGKAADDWRAGNEAIKKIQQETDAELLAMATKAKAELEKILSAPSVTTKPQAPAMAVPNKDALNASMAAAEEQIKAADEVYKQQAEKYSSEFKLHQITESEKTAATLAALDVRYNAELVAVSGEIALYAQGTAGYQRAMNERTQATLKFNEEKQKIIDQGLQEEAAQWNKVFSSIEGAFNSQLRGLLAGTTTWASAMKSIMGDLVIKFIEGSEKMVFDWIEGEILKTGATTTGVAARTAAESAGAATSVGTQLAAAMSSIAIDVGQTFANLAAWLTATLGPAGIPVALGLSAGVAGLAISQMKHLDVGGYVLSQGVAMLHPGETVVPAQVNTPYAGVSAGAGGGASPNLTLNISAIDGQSVQRFFQQNASQIMRIFNSHGAINPSQA